VPSKRNITAYRELCCGGGALDAHMKGLIEDAIAQLTDRDNNGPPKTGKTDEEDADNDKEEKVVQKEMVTQKEMVEIHDPKTTTPTLTPTLPAATI
jgi:hypothetical protein